ncbi:hypothetical protein FPV67DRAFT_1707687 [Lyophyllum atratum]|nr:hypothetical protein FPV67DRAFT_1707687 [Lyophyllum atratum]
MSTPNRKPYSKSTWRQQPTHFLAVPLHTNPTLRSRITAFQTHLFQPGAHPDGTRKALIRGLDNSIVIDPMRFHLTLGVMALDEEAGIEDRKDSLEKVDPPQPNAPLPGTPHSSTSPVPTSPPFAERQQPPQLPHPSASPKQNTTGKVDPPQPNSPPPSTPHPSTSPAPRSPPLAEHQNPPQPPRTVATALALLRSLGPHIDAILSGGTPRPSTEGTTADAATPELLASKLELRVTLDSLDIMRPVKLKPPKPNHILVAWSVTVQTVKATTI